MLLCCLNSFKQHYLLLHITTPWIKKLDLPRRPRWRCKQRTNLPGCNQLAKSRWITHLEQRLLFVFFLYRRTSNTSGTEVLFSNEGKNQRLFVFLHIGEATMRKRIIQPTSDWFCKRILPPRSFSVWVLRHLSFCEEVPPASGYPAGIHCF